MGGEVHAGDAPSVSDKAVYTSPVQHGCRTGERSWRADRENDYFDIVAAIVAAAMLPIAVKGLVAVSRQSTHKLYLLGLGARLYSGK